MSDLSELPAYEEELDATHRAFEAELRKCVQSLRIDEGSQLLDLACGDGYFTKLLAESHPQASKIYGIDRMLSYVQTAQQTTRAQPRVEIALGNAYALDFASESLDLVWCAQSLISLEDAQRALDEITRVLKPGGTLAVMEQDQFHELLLPWPVDLELAIQAGLAQQSAEAGRDPYVGRAMRSRLEKAGFTTISRTTFVADRSSPLDETQSRFLAARLERLKSLTPPCISERDKLRLQQLCDPNSSESLLRKADLEFSYLFWLWTCKRP